MNPKSRQLALERAVVLLAMWCQRAPSGGEDLRRSMPQVRPGSIQLGNAIAAPTARTRPPAQRLAIPVIDDEC